MTRQTLSNSWWPKLAVTLLTVTLALWPLLEAEAADMSAGYSFTPNDRVTSTKLNNLVGAGSINTTFITDKTTAQPVAADSLLFYSASAGAFRKTTLNVLSLQNTNLIVSQTEKSAPSTNDYFLLWDASANTFKKCSLLSLTTNQYLIDNQVRSTNAPLPGGLFLYSSNGVFYGTALTNLFQEWWRWQKFSTNLPSATTNLPNALLSFHTTPTNTDLLWIWDSVNSTGKVSTISGLVTNQTAAVRLTNASDLFLLGYQTNTTNVVKVKPNQIVSVYTNIFSVPGANTTATNAHGLPGKPQLVRWTLIETNSGPDNGYVVGDEVDTGAIAWGGTSIQMFWDSTNVYWLYRGGVSSVTVALKDSSGTFSVTKSSWNVKVYAFYYPN